MMGLHMDFRTTLAAASAASALFLSTGCSGHASPPAPQMQLTRVSVAPAAQKEIVEQEEFTGRTEAMETVEVRPRVSGHLREVQFHSGQLVKKGDVLFEIDPRWHQAEFDRRKAEYEQARARLENAEREARRTEQLLSSKAISAEEAEARQSRFSEAKAGVIAAEAARDSAKLDLEFTVIRAPIDGRVSRALVTPGNFVSGVAGNATLLTTIVTVDPVYVYADLDEQSLLKFNQLLRARKLPNAADGSIPVELQLANEQGYPHRGVIESFDNHLDPGTGSILLRAIFPNAGGEIVPGLFARIRVPLSESYPAVLISEAAVGTDQARKFVLTLNSSNVAEYRPVTLGPMHDGLRVVRSGLKPGEEIIVNGLAKVRPGMPVQPERVGGVAPSTGLAQR